MKNSLDQRLINARPDDHPSNAAFVARIMAAVKASSAPETFSQATRTIDATKQKGLFMKLRTLPKPILAALALALALAVSGAAYAAYHAYHKQPAPRPGHTQTNTVTISPPTTNTQLPDGFVGYQNTDLGFMFAYPKEWGDAVADDHAASKQAGAFKGDFLTVKFKDNKNVTIQTVSRDYQVLGAGDGNDNCAGSAIYQRIVSPNDVTASGQFENGSVDGSRTYNAFLSQGADYYVNEQYEYYPSDQGGVGICPGYTVGGAKVFSSTSKLTGVAFDWYQYGVDCCTMRPSQTEYDAFVKDKNSVLAAAEKQKIVEVVKFITEL